MSLYDPQHHELSQVHESALLRLEKEFTLTEEDLKRVVASFVDRFTRHLQNYDKTDMPMLPSFVTKAPSGEEKGTYLSLDLGGTNLRVCKVELKGGRKFTLQQHKEKIAEEEKTGTSEMLFGHIAETVGNFVSQGDTLPLGFTFSFPVSQFDLNHGKLMYWAKGFNVADAIDQDIAALLQEQLDKRGIDVKCRAIVNDTVGTLMAASYQSGGRTLVASIFGTGTNGAYFEKTHNVGKLGTFFKDRKDVPETMAINTEWGSFDDSRHDVLNYTDFDRAVDASSINPGHHAFEKQISGMYLGEILRLVIKRLVSDPKVALFRGYTTLPLETHYGLDTAVMSKLEDVGPLNKVDLAHHVRSVLAAELQVQPDRVSDDDAIVVHRMSVVIGTRAALLASCALSGVIEKTSAHNASTIGIACDGSLIEHYPGFVARILRGIAAVLGSEIERRCEILSTQDGSGMGAALCAWSAVHKE